MSSKKAKSNLSATAQSRLKEFEAKQQLQKTKENRRSRDNRVAVIAAVVIIVVALGAQFSYFSFGPGSITATPSATPTVTSSPSSTATATASPSATSTSSVKPSPSDTGVAPASAACLNKPAPKSGKKGAAPTSVPAASTSENRNWSGSMYVNGCKLEIKLDGAKAPQAVANFIALAKSGFYNDNYCHRISNSGLFMLQCGDPNGDGTGGPGYSFGPNNENAPADGLYKAGVIAMANSGGNASQGSQFFIVYADSPLSPNYAVVGTVTSGIDKIAALGALGNDGSSAAGGGKPNLDPIIGPIVLN